MKKIRRKDNPKIVILGAGPCGLGAAWRLKELGYDNFQVFEKNPYPGGLAASFKDEKGFTWDIGGHVEFSHYEYYDRVFETLLKEDQLKHERESWIYLKERFVPYPFQYHIRYLPKEDIWRCLQGLMRSQEKHAKKPRNFKEWILGTFGNGMAELFLLPHNEKVWAYPLEKMSYEWIGERVALLDFQRVLENIILEKDDRAWGPNNTFRYPLRGGTGEVWRRLHERVKEKVLLGYKAEKIYTKKKYIEFQNGRKEEYDVLLNTIPLDVFRAVSDLPNKAPLTHLVSSAIHIVGIGLEGFLPKGLNTKCWIYFPEDAYLFSRVTVLSRYSPFNVPDANRYWSLMAEVTESSYRKISHQTVTKGVVEGMKHAKLIDKGTPVVDIWHHYEPHGYPTPSLNRPKALRVLPLLETFDIYSRGRFGAWKYEVSNQDHTFMQGVELINRLLLGEKETTVWHPEIVNNKKR